MLWKSTLQVVGWCGWCAGLYCAFLVVWTLLRKDKPRRTRRWTNFLATLKRARDRNDGAARVVLATLLAVLVHRQTR